MKTKRSPSSSILDSRTAYLTPTRTFSVPASPKSEGYETQRVAVELHHFAATKPRNLAWGFLWAHGTGFHKEFLHPLMRRFANYLRSQPQYDSIDIDFIAWDARNHGDSARLNEGTFSAKCKPRYSCILLKPHDIDTIFDNAMDAKQVVDQLEFKSYDMLIGIGHSFGATSL